MFVYLYSICVHAYKCVLLCMSLTDSLSLYIYICICTLFNSTSGKMKVLYTKYVEQDKSVVCN